ncbi:hypothetical protein KBA39_06950 [Myxococcota bacterium]|nr:hypothetical protein [Myxococcota bacterium]
MIRATLYTTILLLVCAFLSWIGLFGLVRDYIAGVVRVYSYDPLWFTVWVGLLLVAARIIVTIFTRGGDWNGPHSTGEE